MASRTVLISCLVSLAGAQFVPPNAILQAGYPMGFRAFIPDFPGCEMFAFHGKINSPFTADEPGDLSNEILRPQDGFWTFQDLNVVLTPGDILHYWTMIVKDKVPYPKKNLTWKVPDPDETVDLLSPITLKPPKTKPTKSPKPEKMRDTEPTTPAEDSTTLPTESTDDDTSAEPSETSSTTEKTTPQATTTKAPTTTTKKPPTTTKKPTTEKPKTNKPKKSTPSPIENAEEIEELTTPVLPFDKPITGEFPEEEPPLFPFPSLFPRPFPKPIMPPVGPGFEICSNPWNFEERPGESRTQRLERQVAKLQCELAMNQRGYNQLTNTVENELTNLKKLVYGAMARMARLENLLRSAAFG